MYLGVESIKNLAFFLLLLPEDSMLWGRLPSNYKKQLVFKDVSFRQIMQGHSKFTYEWLEIQKSLLGEIEFKHLIKLYLDDLKKEGKVWTAKLYAVTPYGDIK